MNPIKAECRQIESSRFYVHESYGKEEVLYYDPKKGERLFSGVNVFFSGGSVLYVSPDGNYEFELRDA